TEPEPDAPLGGGIVERGEQGARRGIINMGHPGPLPHTCCFSWLPHHEGIAPDRRRGAEEVPSCGGGAGKRIAQGAGVGVVHVGGPKGPVLAPVIIPGPTTAVLPEIATCQPTLSLGAGAELTRVLTRSPVARSYT